MNRNHQLTLFILKLKNLGNVVHETRPIKNGTI